MCTTRVVGRLYVHHPGMLHLGIYHPGMLHLGIYHPGIMGGYAPPGYNGKLCTTRVCKETGHIPPGYVRRLGIYHPVYKGGYAPPGV